MDETLQVFLNILEQYLFRIKNTSYAYRIDELAVVYKFSFDKQYIN